MSHTSKPGSRICQNAPNDDEQSVFDSWPLRSSSSFCRDDAMTDPRTFRNQQKQQQSQGKGKKSVMVRFQNAVVIATFLLAAFVALCGGEMDIDTPPEHDEVTPARSLGRRSPTIRIEDTYSSEQADNLDNSLSSRSTIEFIRRHSSTPMIFHKKDVDVPPPQFWMPAADNLQNSSDSWRSNVPAEWASVWYGEAIIESSSSSQGHASFIMNAKGQVYGTVFDGVDSYTINSCISEDRTRQYRYGVVPLDELPDEFSADADDDGENNPFEARPSGRRLHSKVGEPDRNWLSSRRTLQSIDDMVILNVAVIYTEQAKLTEGGDSAIHNLIGLSVFQTNIAFANSASNIRVRLVHTFQDQSFPDDGSVNGWHALRTDGDGYFDYWEELRNETGADSIVVIVDRLPRWCGRAQSGGPLALVTRGCSAKAGRYSFGHEIGHWLRAGHDSNSKADFDNRGYIDNEHCFRTLMAYHNCNCSSCPRILYYSNNRTTYEGLAVGSEFLENNIRTMEMNTPAARDNYQFHSLQEEPIVFCQHNPCEEAPLMLSENYNGDGRCSYIPGSGSISLLRIPEGVSVEVFDSFNCEGTHRVFGTPLVQSNEAIPLESRSLVNVSLAEYGMENQLASFVIRPIPTGQTVTLCVAITCKSHTSRVSNPEGRTPGKVTLSVGSYITMPLLIGEDRLSRVELPIGWKIQLFESRRFRGESLTLSNEAGRSTPWPNQHPIHGHGGTSLRGGTIRTIALRGRYREWNNRARSMIISTI